MKKLLRWIACNIIGDHEWTCKAKEGVKPTEFESSIYGFREYAKMYCKHCKKESKLNSRL